MEDGFEIAIDENKLLEKINYYKEQIKQLKGDNSNLVTQLTLLKAEIKNLKVKNSDLICFNGRISNYSDFSASLNLLLENYKGKKSGKEYDEAFKKIKAHFSLNLTSDGDVADLTAKDDSKSVSTSINKDKEKKGFLGIFGKK